MRRQREERGETLAAREGQAVLGVMNTYDREDKEQIVEKRRRSERLAVRGRGCGVGDLALRGIGGECVHVFLEDWGNLVAEGEVGYPCNSKQSKLIIIKYYEVDGGAPPPSCAATTSFQRVKRLPALPILFRLGCRIPSNQYGHLQSRSLGWRNQRALVMAALHVDV